VDGCLSPPNVCVAPLVSASVLSAKLCDLFFRFFFFLQIVAYS